MKVTVSKAKGRDVLGIKGLLIEVGLPIIGVDEAFDNFRVVRHEGQIIACGGLEKYGIAALMRSVAVVEAYRGKGIGERVVNNLFRLARSLDAWEVVLFTLDAESYFKDFGFETVGWGALTEEFEDSWVLEHHECDGAVVMLREMI
jgi:amino-acid N-acetyltransferase